MFNQVVLVGRLGKDPELAHTKSGKAIAKFSIATTRGFGDKEETDWNNVLCWEKTAEAVNNYLHKGSLVLVSGRLQTRKYEGKNGTQFFTEVVAQEIKFLEPKQSKTEDHSSDEITDDDLPF